MAPLPPWADLDPDLLRGIGDRLELNCYASARGACGSWRRALAPPSPALLVVAEGAAMAMSMSMRRPSAAPLLARRPFKLAAIASGSRCVGSSDGWLALCIRVGRYKDRCTAFFLVNPVTGAEIALPPLFYESRWISKAVFAPGPAEDDFAAAAICNDNRVVYVTAGATRWAVLDPVRLACGDQLTDLVYHDQGKVYCLTRCGDVHVLRLPERRRRKPATVQDPKFSVLRPPEHIEVWQPEDLVLNQTVPATIAPTWKRSPESGGPDLNAPATVEPLLSAGSHPFKPAAAFAPPYDVVSALTGAKNLVFCEGNLYQVWRNTSCTVTLRVMPGVGQRRVLEGEVFVLRYYPQRRPCWDVVRDLGGYSVFVGRNNAVPIYAEGVPGLRGNCVYWIDGHGRDQGMVFDMETGRSTPCRPPPVVPVRGYPHSAICWYFLRDMVSTSRQQQ